MTLKFASALCAGLLGAAFWLVPAAKADEWDKKTDVRFSAPVEIPGRVLPPGEYVFKLMDSQSNRNIVQVFNGDETHLWATILAIPDYRMNPPDKPVITFEERTKDSPEAVRAWFYPGDPYGEEFVYPKPRAIQIAQAAKQPVLATPAQMAPAPPVAEMKKAPVVRVSPKGNETEIAKAIPPVPPAPAPAPAPPTTPKQLPRTASDMPLIGLLGLASLSLSLGLRAVGKRLA